MDSLRNDWRRMVPVVVCITPSHDTPTTAPSRRRHCNISRAVAIALLSLSANALCAVWLLMSSLNGGLAMKQHSHVQSQRQYELGHATPCRSLPLHAMGSSRGWDTPDGWVSLLCQGRTKGLLRCCYSRRDAVGVLASGLRPERREIGEPRLIWASIPFTL